MAIKRNKREPIVLSQMRPATLFFVLCGCILVTFGLIHISEVTAWLKKIFTALEPVIVGFVFAYLLNPAAVWLEKRFQKVLAKPIAKHERLRNLPRVISSFLAVLLFIGSITLLVTAVFSQVISGVSTFLDKLPDYVNTVAERAEQLLHGDSTVSAYLQQLVDKFSATEIGTGQIDTVEVSQKALSVLASGASGTFGFIYNVVIGFIVAVYLLISKERFLRQWKQVLYAVCKPKTAHWIDEKMSNANDTFGTAIVGKTADSAIIGILCFIGVTIMKMPYAALIAVIIGITNMVPYFGPILGAIPCFLLILMESPMKALYFVIFIVILQQFDANILDPKIVGTSLGLPAFWELFACMLGGGVFGIIGLIIGVPLFAMVYGVVEQLVVELLGERVKNSELDAEFVHDTLGVTEAVAESGFFDEDNQDSPYVENLVLLEEISEQPISSKKNSENEPPQ